MVGRFTSRIRIVGTGAAAVVLAFSVAACGGGHDETTVGVDSTPLEVAEAAGLHGVHSGIASGSLIVSKLKTKEVMSLSFSGGFKQPDQGGRPQFYLAADSKGRWNGRTIEFNSRLLVLADSGIINYGPAGKEGVYEIEGSTLEGLASKLSLARTDEGESDMTACPRAAEGFDFSQLLRDPEVEGRHREGDGTEVVVVKGELAIPRLQNLLVGLAKDPDCGAQMKALGLPSAAELEAARVDFKKGFGGPYLTLAVDSHGVFRGLSTRFECARLNGELFELQLDLGLAEPNQEVDVSGEAETKPLDSLLRKFGTTQEAILRAGADEAVIAFLEELSGAMTGRLP